MGGGGMSGCGRCAWVWNMCSCARYWCGWEVWVWVCEVCGEVEGVCKLSVGVGVVCGSGCGYERWVWLVCVRFACGYGRCGWEVGVKGALYNRQQTPGFEVGMGVCEVCVCCCVGHVWEVCVWMDVVGVGVWDLWV